MTMTGSNREGTRIMTLRPTKAPSRAVYLGATVLMATLALAGCKRALVYSDVQTDGYRSVHPITLKEVPQSLDVPVGRHTTRLNKAQKQTIVGFASEARTKGNGSIEIHVPSGSANESAANHMAGQIRKLVRRGGIPGHRIAIRGYAVSDTRSIAPVRLVYLSVRASVHKCGIWPDNLAVNGKNEDYSEFGCTTQANFAAMLANPSDLLHPRASTPADAARRATVLEKYQKGEATSSAKEDDNSTISEIGG